MTRKQAIKILHEAGYREYAGGDDVFMRIVPIGYGQMVRVAFDVYEIMWARDPLGHIHARERKLVAPEDQGSEHFPV